MSVYKHKNGRWYYKFYIRGKQFHKSIPEATDKEGAKMVEARIKGELLHGNYEILLDKKTTSFVKLCEEFEEYSKVNRLKSYEAVDKYYIEIFKNYFKNKAVEDISTPDIEKFRNKDIGDIGSSTINRKMSCLSSMFSLAFRNDYIKENPCNGIKKLKEEKRADRFLSKEEETKLLEKCTKEYLYMKPIIICALYTGMRKSEILNLKWNNINFKDNFIHLLITKTIHRKIPIAKTLLKELEVIPQISDFVFANPETKSKYYDIKRPYKKILENSGIKPIRFHDLRHTAATRMVASGIDLIVVGEILGHSQIKTTARYSHPVPERKLQAIKALDNFEITQNEKHDKQSKYSRKFKVVNMKSNNLTASRKMS